MIKVLENFNNAYPSLCGLTFFCTYGLFVVKTFAFGYLCMCSMYFNTYNNVRTSKSMGAKVHSHVRIVTCAHTRIGRVERVAYATNALMVWRDGGIECLCDNVSNLNSIAGCCKTASACNKVMATYMCQRTRYAAKSVQQS